MTQVCGVDGCHHFFYDPLGRLVGYQDEDGLPVSLLWGRTGIENDAGDFEMVPLLHGGERWLHSPFGVSLFWGFNPFVEGYIFSMLGNQNWLIQGEEIVSKAALTDGEKSVIFQQNHLVHEGLNISFLEKINLG